MRTSRSSTSNVVVAYVSMTCTPFRSSMVSPGRAARPRTYSFRAIRAGAAGPWLQGKAGARVGFLWPADLPTAGGWVGPPRCAGAGGRGRGGGLWAPPGGRPGSPQFWGRGCADTKGNLIMQLLAVQAWQGVEGRPPINLKFVVEGEEEVGSPHFGSFVHANQEILHADGATIEGGDHLHEGTPKIELGCKGILYVEMTSRTAKVDQHSSYAAIAPNPAWRLIQALMTLRDVKGRIKVPGWYKDAPRPTGPGLP